MRRRRSHGRCCRSGGYPRPFRSVRCRFSVVDIDGHGESRRSAAAEEDDVRMRSNDRVGWNWKWSFGGRLSPSRQPARERVSSPALYSSMNSSSYVSRTPSRLASASKVRRRVGEHFADEEGIVGFGDDVGVAGGEEGLDRGGGFVRDQLVAIGWMATRDCCWATRRARRQRPYRPCRRLGGCPRPCRSVRCQCVRRRYRRAR